MDHILITNIAFIFLGIALGIGIGWLINKASIRMMKAEVEIYKQNSLQAIEKNKLETLKIIKEMGKDGNQQLQEKINVFSAAEASYRRDSEHKQVAINNAYLALDRIVHLNEMPLINETANRSLLELQKYIVIKG